MNFSKFLNNKSIIGTHFAISFLFVLAFLIIPHPINAASWICFAFTIISILINCVVSCLAFEDKKSIISKIYGIPIFRIGFMYLIIQFLFGLIIYIIDAFVFVPYWIALLVCMILVVLVLIGITATINVRETIEKIDAETKQSIKNNLEFRLDLDEIADCCSDKELSKQIYLLSEKFRYSDPVSSDATKDIEEEIAIAVEDLRIYVYEKDKESIKRKLDLISRKLVQRNRICKLNKS